jgi:hypothetical protein
MLGEGETKGGGGMKTSAPTHANEAENGGPNTVKKKRKTEK